jgi:hypothetical protein
MAISYQFLPWVRRGLNVALDAVDDLGAGSLPARPAAHVGVKLAGPHAGTAITPLPMRLYGPGDVIAIDTRLVVRTDPKPGATNFEPNYLAIVDFDPPDFPWMLTPARANGDDRLRPWLVLLVLDLSKVRRPKMEGSSLLPVVRIAADDVADELPDLGESWSWAHAQVVSTAVDAAGIQADLQGDPRSNVSRLVCPRRLEPNKDYVACVVPAFKPGVKRGLGLAGTAPDPEMDTLAPAWDVDAEADVRLPVYHHWEFSTGPGGDFESLARRLRTPGSYKGTPVEAQLTAIGTSPMSVDDLLNGDTPGLQTTMEGALVPISYEPGEPPEPQHAQALEFIVNTPFDQVANPVADGPTNAQGKRIEVKPPLVGAWHAKQHEVHPPALGAHWLADLNLNPRYRGAAGYGAEVVRENQEDYVDACWDQIGDILDAEMKLNLTRLAIEAQLALKKKHFDPLPPERLLQVAGPALPRIESLAGDGVPYRIAGQTASLGGQIDRSSLPAALASTAMRRMASPQRPALRMAARLNGSRFEALHAMTARYVGVMAQATSKPAAFSVNAFTPDGILGTTMFEGVDIVGSSNNPLDLTELGLGRKFTAPDVRKVLAAGAKARSTFERVGLPDIPVRVSARDGVFTDVHVERFGALTAVAPSVTPADWNIVTDKIRPEVEAGIEGVIIQVHPETGVLQIDALRLDGRSGRLELDRPIARFNRLRRELRLEGVGRAPAKKGGTAGKATGTGAKKASGAAGKRATAVKKSAAAKKATTSAAAAKKLASMKRAAGKAAAKTAAKTTTRAGEPATARAGLNLGQLRVQDFRLHDTAGLLANLPIGALDPTRPPTGPLVQFELGPNFEFNRPTVPPVVTPPGRPPIVTPPGRPPVVTPPGRPPVVTPPGRPPIDLPGGRPPVVTVTVPPPLHTREVLTRFSTATEGTVALWRDAFQATKVELQAIDFALARAADIVRTRTNPELTLAARRDSIVSIAQLPLSQAMTDAASAFVAPYLTELKLPHRFMIPALFDRVMAWPHLREPLYKALADHDPEAFMPGIGDLPQDLIMLVQVNQFFIDAFMAGANFEMNRELLWRAFPTDLRGTPFQRFWGRVRAGGDGKLQPLDDMEPIHLWRKQPLGKRVDENITDPNRIALLVRGQLLRRYPNTAVYAWKRRPNAPADETQLLKDANGLPPAGAIQTPVFAGVIPPDITFFGFDIDREDAGDWCFVLEEQMSEPRFGFDVEEPAPQQGIVGMKRRSALRTALLEYATPGNALVARKYNPYKALTWAQVGVQAGKFAGLANLMAPDAGFADFPALVETATAAEVAKALLQQPFRGYFVGDDLKS